MDNVEIEVVDTPISELLLEDGLDLLGFVERVPELADDEEVLALDDALLDGTGYTLSGLDLVAIICPFVSKRRREVEAGSKIQGN